MPSAWLMMHRLRSLTCDAPGIDVTFVGLHEYCEQTGVKTRITLIEPDDHVAPEAGGEDGDVFRSVRILLVEDKYEVVKTLIRVNVN